MRMTSGSVAEVIDFMFRTIVLADADLAARLVAIAGFGLTGQACTATSRVIVERSVADAFAVKLVEKAKAIVVVNGLKADFAG
jgi:alpha-ketoglutaric semialdehyde dehydrogenase